LSRLNRCGRKSRKKQALNGRKYIVSHESVSGWNSETLDTHFMKRLKKF
jgi:hypothetical protein